MHHSPIEPLEPRIAPAVFTVAVQSPVMEPEDGRTYELVFTITLSGEITADASVKFATADNSAESSGILRDYIENHGTLVFTPLAGIAEQTKEVRVTVVADAWREYTESMQMVLSEPTGDAELGNSIAPGTIEDDGDSTVGIYVRNSATVEGGTALFTVALTGAPDNPVTFLSTTRNGTATASDFTGFSARESTIPAFLSQIFIGVDTTPDAAFESSEQFHLDLTNASGAVLVAGAASASGTIYNDDARIVSAREFEFVDEDGDLVNVRLSKGALFERGPLGQFQDRGVVSLVGSGTVGGRHLEVINFLGTGNEFFGTDVFVTVRAQPGFDLETDGKANVGAIIAAQSQFGGLSAVGSLGTVKIDGNLGRVESVNIKKLEVDSLGRTAQFPDADISVLYGKAGTIVVHGDVFGALALLGTRPNPKTGVAMGIGSIGSLTIEGGLIGGDSQYSGSMVASSKIGRVTIGKIIGGSSPNSGFLSVEGKIGSLTIKGDIVGGDSEVSGQVVAKAIGTANLRSVIGGAGGSSESAGSGAVISLGKIASLTMTGEIRGGDGDNSGIILAQGKVGSVQAGRIQGGSGFNSGRLEVRGDLSNLRATDIRAGHAGFSGSVVIGGRLGSGIIAGISGPDFLDDQFGTLDSAGTLRAGDIGTLVVTGDVSTGFAGGNEFSLCGSISSRGSIGTLNILGKLIGHDGQTATILAGNRIGKLSIGELTSAEVLAGYSLGAPLFESTGRGTLVNAGARIGTVVVGKWTGSSIVAGALPGEDLVFGTEDDSTPTGGQNPTAAKSKITSITIREVIGIGATTGIVAQSIGKVTLIQHAGGRQIPIVDGTSIGSPDLTLRIV